MPFEKLQDASIENESFHLDFKTVTTLLYFLFRKTKTKPDLFFFTKSIDLFVKSLNTQAVYNLIHLEIIFISHLYIFQHTFSLSLTYDIIMVHLLQLMNQC